MNIPVNIQYAIVYPISKDKYIKLLNEIEYQKNPDNIHEEIKIIPEQNKIIPEKNKIITEEINKDILSRYNKLKNMLSIEYNGGELVDYIYKNFLPNQILVFLTNKQYSHNTIANYLNSILRVENNDKTQHIIPRKYQEDLKNIIIELQLIANKTINDKTKILIKEDKKDSIADKFLDIKNNKEKYGITKDEYMALYIMILTDMRISDLYDIQYMSKEIEIDARHVYYFADINEIHSMSKKNNIFARTDMGAEFKNLIKNEKFKDGDKMIAQHGKNWITEICKKYLNRKPTEIRRLDANLYDKSNIKDLIKQARKLQHSVQSQSTYYEAE